MKYLEIKEIDPFSGNSILNLFKHHLFRLRILLSNKLLRGVFYFSYSIFFTFKGSNSKTITNSKINNIKILYKYLFKVELSKNTMVISKNGSDL
jgi:hypothetical protein